MACEKLKARAERELADLGSTAEQIAESLRVQGVKGHKGISRSCVLQRFLERKVPVPGFTWDVGGSVACANGVVLGLPSGHQDLVRKFDAGAYPDLVEA